MKLREVLFCIALAFSLTAHTAMAAPPETGAFGESTRLVGRDEMCLSKVDVYRYYSPIILSECHDWKSRQLWRIFQDGTIRDRKDGYCLAPHSHGIKPVGTNVVLVNCSSEETGSDMKWTKKNDGTILHDESGLVLTGKPGNFVTLEANEYAPSQSWAATESLSPMVVNIKWLDNLCLQFIRGEILFVALNECSRDNKNQRWALYGDGTIRQNDNKNFCLISNGKISGSLILVSKCEDEPQQRWGLANDNTIGHPNTNLVIDVHRFVRLSPLIVVNDRAGTASQRWTIY